MISCIEIDNPLLYHLSTHAFYVNIYGIFMYDQEHSVQRYMSCLSLANLFLDRANFPPRRTSKQ